MAKKAVKKALKKAPKKVAKKVVKKSVKKSPPAKKVAKKVAKVVRKAAPVTVAKKPAAKKVAPKAAPKVVAKPVAPAAGAVVASKVPGVGSAAPGFALPSSQGRTISLGDYANKTVVLYFYPKADTPGCTVEACGFRDAIASYGSLSVDVLGVSPDPVGDVTKFAEKFKLTFPLLADADHKVCEAYGVWVEKSMYGKKYFGAARTTFIVRNGVVAKVFEKVKPEGHEAEVLAAVKGM